MAIEAAPRATRKLVVARPPQRPPPSTPKRPRPSPRNSNKGEYEDVCRMSGLSRGELPGRGEHGAAREDDDTRRIGRDGRRR